MNPEPVESPAVRFDLRRRRWDDNLPLIVSHLVALALVFARLAMVCGCTWLVFWRGESAWLYAVAALFVWLFRR